MKAEFARSRRQSVCLSMIVRNEALVIARCLQSVRPIIDYWVIVDTGSTDGTQDAIRRCLHDLPGELHERPWVDFGYNRSEALALARPRGDYTLIIDADDVLELPPGFVGLPRLRADSYSVENRHMEKRYWRPQLIRNAVAWRFEGVLHEFLSCELAGKRMVPADRSHGRLAGVGIRMSEEGARRRTDPAQRYRTDAMTIEKAMMVEVDPFLVARYTFYLAQSLEDAGDKQQALDIYRRRAELGFWRQEVFVSLLRAARLMAELGFLDNEIIATYLCAHRTANDRTEALYDAARVCRLRSRYREGYEIARRGFGLKMPLDGLFVEQWIYEYGLSDELAVNAYFIGKYDECFKIYRRLLANPDLPTDVRQRFMANARAAQEQLQHGIGTTAGIGGEFATRTNAGLAMGICPVSFDSLAAVIDRDAFIREELMTSNSKKTPSFL
jgi:glycosyltransferase involved in cell wall biosynthesis